MAPLLVLEDISLAFGGVTALHGVDAAVEERDICAIIGPNGAGKSSLLNVISGIHAPQAGCITFAGKRYAAMPVAELARLGIARTFQNLALFKAMSVFENIVMGRVFAVRSNVFEQVAGAPRARREETENRERAEAIVEFLGLRRVRNALAGTLPYGLQKRVELGRALIAAPRLLLLDEPMAGMSASEKLEMCWFVLEARRHFGTAVVLIEHDIGLVIEISDRVIVLDYGRKIADGTPDAVRSDGSVIDAYVGAA